MAGRDSQNLKLRPVILSLWIAFGHACAPTDSGSAGNSSTTSNARPSDDATRSPTLQQLEGLFQNEITFSANDLRTGATSCELILRHGDLGKNVIPWPSSLRRFLADQLAQFPARAMVMEAVAGIYLVESQALSTAQGSLAAGLACDVGPDRRGVIFLNELSFVTEREAEGLQTFQKFVSHPSPYLRIETGDNAAITLVHEVVHAIDNKFFQNGSDSSLRQKRLAAYGLSWRRTSRDEPLFRRAQGLNLVAGSAANPSVGFMLDEGPGLGCRKFLNKVPMMLASSAMTPTEVAEELRYLAEETNFIVPYTQENAAEDFAESLAVYYYGAYKNSWQIRSAYRKDLQQFAAQSEDIIYQADTRQIPRITKIQRDKLCAFAELLFKGECLLPPTK